MHVKIKIIMMMMMTESLLHGSCTSVMEAVIFSSGILKKVKNVKKRFFFQTNTDTVNMSNILTFENGAKSTH